MAPKRQLTLSASFGSNKKLKLSDASKDKDAPPQASSSAARAEITELPGKIASAQAAALVDAHPPYEELKTKIEASHVRPVEPGESVVYWMRMEDMRLEDNRALSLASEHAVKYDVPLVVMFIISPGDYESHDRSPRRIDFMLRNLKYLKTRLYDLHVPLYILTHTKRKTLPNLIVKTSLELNATRIFANMEYEVDELRRDLAVVRLARGGTEPLEATFVADKFIVEPGVLHTKQGKMYKVFTPWLKTWTEAIHKSPSFIDASSPIQPNKPSATTHPLLQPLFDSPVPDSVAGFECDDRDKMEQLWPAGIDAARQMFSRFLHTKSRSVQHSSSSPLPAEGVEDSNTQGRAGSYKIDRDRCDIDSSSKMSPYLASGVISCRELIRSCLAQEKQTAKTFTPDRASSIGTFISELAWRDFYTYILASFPRTSMGRPFNEKFAGTQWETDASTLDAWMKGMTGVPIVDAGMRQANQTGWMANRARMICAMFLAKDLMLDWRLGERYFMQVFIDGDLASNNGGWQWSASTGTDPVPYFRVFNPYTQSEKADPTGDYIRHFVPELRNLKGKALYNPHEKLSPSEFKTLGYPKPIVDHAEARQRALRRYKNPGEV